MKMASMVMRKCKIAPNDSKNELIFRNRENLISEIERFVKNQDVLQSFKKVRREQFVPPNVRDDAYCDCALPIGFGQTISQPSLVVQMIDFLDLQPGKKVLEIGTGSGYQTALLAELAYIEIFSIEIIPELYKQSSTLLHVLGYKNIHLKLGDGYFGWSEYAPFDAIIVAAAPDHIPPALVQQLKEGGIMLIPVGAPEQYQILWKIVKEKGQIKMKNAGSVIFVPFTGKGVRDQSEVEIE
jgi:protein-L-isoaspartate(D-aspartate) O-methyltransferase